MESPILFINIGWMKRYQGQTQSDEFEPGNFGYFKKNKSQNAIGHEQWNFLDRDGMVYGYVPRSSGIDITRLGALPEQDEIKGVLVVFVARDPAVNQLKVVGWYRNATVRRSATFKRSYGEYEVEAPIAARAVDSHILPVVRRGVVIPTAQKIPGGIGQSPVWYATSHPDVVRSVRRLISGKKFLPQKSTDEKVNGNRKGARRNLDKKTRLAVEKVAMDWAMDYFDDTVDVSRECKGWDIEARVGGKTIFVEAKGLSGSAVTVELTPNEYAQMCERKHRYLLFVVTNALTKRAQARIFHFSPSRRGDGAGKWISDIGEVLKVEERLGARATV